jgi:predicted PurR-regulated permease PerM
MDAVPSKQTDYLRIFIYLMLSLVLLYLGRTLFIPLSFALFISFVIYPLTKWLENKKFSRGTSIFISMLFILIPIICLILLILRQIFIFGEQWPELQSKIINAINQLYILIADFLRMPQQDVKEWMNKGISGGSSDLFLSLLQNTLTASSVSLVLLLLVPIYTFLILYYRNIFIDFLSTISVQYPKEKIKDLLHDTAITYNKFVKGMLIVYLSVGIMNSLGLYLLGIPDAFFYGFITSILTIVPYIGILAGAIVPITVAWISFDSIWYPVGIVSIFTFVQILEANLIFPIAVGKRLDINPLIILIVVIAGGIIWGVSGMILFIPFVGILKLLSDKVDSLKPLSILLGRGNK